MHLGKSRDGGYREFGGGLQEVSAERALRHFHGPESNIRGV